MLVTAPADTLATWFQRMRQQRGLSQQALGDRAGVSHFTVGRAESAAAPSLKASTLAQLYVALHSLAPINAQDHAEFLRRSGLSEAALLVAGLRAAKPAELHASTTIDVPQEMVQLCGRLVMTFGAAEAATMLRDWSMSVGVRGQGAGPAMLRVEWPAEGGFHVTEYVPATPPPSPPAPIAASTPQHRTPSAAIVPAPKVLKRG